MRRIADTDSRRAVGGAAPDRRFVSDQTAPAEPLRIERRCAQAAPVRAASCLVDRINRAQCLMSPARSVGVRNCAEMPTHAQIEIVGYSLVIAGLAAASPAHAHRGCSSPTPWIVEDGMGGPQKGGPCGPGGYNDTGAPMQTNKVTTFHAGDEVSLEWEITVPHTASSKCPSRRIAARLRIRRSTPTAFATTRRRLATPRIQCVRHQHRFRFHFDHGQAARRPDLRQVHAPSSCG